MVTIYPFKALRPKAEYVAQIASVPYDVITREEGKQLAENNPYSFLHVIRPDIDFDEEVSAEAPHVYEQAKIRLQQMLQQELFLQEKEPRFYLYQLQRNEHIQTGLVCCASILDYEQDRIKKHEKTRKDKEADRVQHIRVLSAHDEPCFLFFKTQQTITTLMDKILKNETPLYHFQAEDGITHRVYPVPETKEFVDLFQKVPALYVADGHHRTQAAYLLGKEQQLRNGSDPTGHESYNAFLTVLFPQEQLRILPYNRIVKNFGSLSPETFFQKFEAIFPRTEKPLQKGVLRCYWNGQWTQHQILPTLYGNTPVDQLDVSVLQQACFAQLLGITDPRTDSRLVFVGGSEEKIPHLVDKNKYAFGISLFPVSIGELISIADAGEILPPKSTWFEPKLRSGLFIHSFESDVI